MGEGEGAEGRLGGGVGMATVILLAPDSPRSSFLAEIRGKI